MWLLTIILLFNQRPSPTSAENCKGLVIVSRDDWNAVEAKKSVKISAVLHVFIHHTTGVSCTSHFHCEREVRQVQRFHIVARGWDDVGYAFLIGGDGRVYEGRGWSKESGYTKGFNENGIDIAFIGNFSRTLPPPKMLKVAKALINCGLSLKKILSNYKLHGHRDAVKTKCPGDALYNVIKRWPRFQAGPLSN